MKKLTLQWRITILTAMVLLVCTVTLTAISMHNVQPLFWLAAGTPEIDSYISSTGEDTPVPVQVAKAQFDTRSILFCGLFTALGTVAVYFAAGQALRPLRNLSEKVETVDEHNLSIRLPEAVSYDEISRLTKGFNRMLSRLDDAFLRQKRFTANAAHELKTPLATLKTGVQVLEEDENATIADYQEQNRAVLESADRLAGIVDDLLVLASAGESIKQAEESVLLEPLFDAIYSELDMKMAQAGITCHIHSGDLSVTANPAYLYRAFFNLMDNACKYAGGGGNLWIKAKERPDNIEISLQDDGPGIAEEHQPYIFDAFYRVDKSRSRALGGSGLGLSIVKAMLEACGGTISVNSDGKNGTCFIIKLPK